LRHYVLNQYWVKKPGLISANYGILASGITMDKSERDNLLARIKAAVLGIAPDAEVLLYGSRARGDAREESDWDIMVILPEEPVYAIESAIQRQLYRIELEIGQIITTVFYSRQEWERKDRLFIPFRRNVRKDAICI